MACEEKIVLRSDCQRVAHESKSVDCESAGHRARYPEINMLSVLYRQKIVMPWIIVDYAGILVFFSHVWALVCVENGCNRNSKI